MTEGFRPEVSANLVQIASTDGALPVTKKVATGPPVTKKWAQVQFFAEMSAHDPFSAKGINHEPLTSFGGRSLPVPAYLAGYGALMQAFDLRVPLHHTMSAVALRGSRRKEEG